MKWYKSVRRITFLYVTIILVFGCEEHSTEPKELGEVSSSSESEAWNSLFIQNTGWFGGDGIFGIPLDGKEFIAATDSTETLFTFSDTMIGHHDGKVLLSENFRMVNNSLAILKGNQPIRDNINFYWKKTDKGEAIALFKPETPNSEPDHYYWLGDGFVNVEGDGKLYIFAYPIRNKKISDPNGFNFEQIGVNLLVIDLDSPAPYHKHLQIPTPFFDLSTQTTFGSAIYVNTESAGAPNPDGYVYVYAVSNQLGVKGLLVSRVPSADFLNFEQWRFWNGDSWVAQMSEAKFVASDVSNEMSVSPLSDGRILLTYQRFTMGPEVAVQIGSSLVGPFKEAQVVYQAPEFNFKNSYFTYNAKAFPHLSNKNALLASYNVNSFDFFNDILKDPTLYRPRFIEIEIQNLE